MPLTRKDFPNGFLFGTATSAYQIEGHAFGGAGRCHWDDFAATPGNVVRAEDGARACDHYHRYPEDFDLVRDGNFDAYRFSTSWSRVMPDGRTINPEGLDYYDRLTDALLDRGLQPYLTLYHWELPSALSDLGGWRNRDIAHWFADYARAVMGRIGDRMTATATVNEPWCIAWLSHFLGHHAPGLRDIRAAARAMHHVLLAHGTAISAMRADGAQNLGAVFNMEYSAPADDSPQAARAADLYDAIYNRFYIEGALQGRYPEALMEGLGPHFPDNWQDDLSTIAQPVDWVGLNYYTRKLITADTGPWPALKEVEGPLPKTFMDWEIYPEGIHHFLTRMARDHTGDLPIYVTENGLAAPDRLAGGVVDDPMRLDFVQAHMQQIKRAIDDGVNVQGYFIWSLLDNYEWALGYEKRFGLVHVDFDTLERTPKSSYHALKSALERS